MALRVTVSTISIHVDSLRVKIIDHRWETLGELGGVLVSIDEPVWGVRTSIKRCSIARLCRVVERNAGNAGLRYYSFLHDSINKAAC
jgi:hypothetical protein